MGLPDTGGIAKQGEVMTEQQQPGQPPAGAPGGYPPQPGYQPPAGAPMGYPPQPGQMPQYALPAQGGYPPPGSYPPPPYGQPMGPVFSGPPQYAGFWIRFGAYIIDWLILTVVCALLSLTCIGIIVAIPLSILYMPWMWWKKGATYGQSALGLRVVRAADGGPIDGTVATMRYIGTMLCGWACGLGYVWAAFEPRKRGWHDMIADTVVIHVG